MKTALLRERFFRVCGDEQYCVVYIFLYIVLRLLVALLC